MTGEIEPSEFIEVRRRIFNHLDALDSLDALFEFQAQLALEILHAESLKARIQTDKGRRLILRDHMRQLRSYGDSLAWLMLHSHTIRQLGKNEPNPPWLTQQQNALGEALDIVKELGSRGIAGIVADLTNIVRIGDVISVTDPECPEIIELKASAVPEERKYLGRRGRQLSRMEGTGKYLKEGRARVYGEDLTRLVIESNVPVSHTFDWVAEAVANAHDIGQAWRRISDHQLVIAIQEDVEIIVPNDIDLSCFSGRPIVIGSHMRPLEESWTTIAPPFGWPLPADHRFLLMEGEIMVIQILDLTAFLGFSHGGGKIVDVDATHEKIGSGLFRVRFGDRVVHIPSTMVRQVVYSHQTVKYVAQKMIEIAAAVVELKPEEGAV